MAENFSGDKLPTQVYVPYVLDGAHTTLTGQVTGTVANTPQLGPDVEGINGFIIRAHPDNTDTVWVFAAAQTKATGFPINATDSYLPVAVRNLRELKFDVDVSGEKICWCKL